MLHVDWFIEPPMDFEQKNYLLLDYVQQIDNSFKIQKVKKTCLIEKLLIKDDQLYVKKDNKIYILIARPEKPISVFISNFRKIQDDQEKKVFLETFTKSVMEISHLKTIEISYKTERMNNFFKIRGLSLHNEKFLKTDDPLVYRWSRFLITFSTRIEINDIKKTQQNIYSFFIIFYNKVVKFPVLFPYQSYQGVNPSRLFCLCVALLP